MTKPTTKGKSSLVARMVQESGGKKEETTRFTFDLTAEMQEKLTALAKYTRRSKASVLKFLIAEAYKDIENL
jgi:hypothetical protein